jgi:putative phosphoesterase
MEIRSVGIVSDTHGELFPDVARAFLEARVDLILHAGDIGGDHVLRRLREIAPVIAVAGNGDEPDYHRHPWDLRLHLGSRRIFLCHWYDNYGRIHPRYAQVLRDWKPHVLVYGHTHLALRERRGGTLFLNPGYAGAPEPSRRRSVATLDIASLSATLHPLADAEEPQQDPE